VKKVTGIGGIFFKCSEPGVTRQWYHDHLGLATDEYGSNFEWRQADDGKRKGFTQWSPFDQDTEYFKSSGQDFMINYRVEDLDGLLAQLETEGVKILGEITRHEFGRFAHIVDCDGRTVELWEPNDDEYDKIVEGRTK